MSTTSGFELGRGTARLTGQSAGPAWALGCSLYETLVVVFYLNQPAWVLWLTINLPMFLDDRIQIPKLIVYWYLLHVLCYDTIVLGLPFAEFAFRIICFGLNLNLKILWLAFIAPIWHLPLLSSHWLGQYYQQLACTNGSNHE